MKKLLALILAMTLVFALAACGGGGIDPSTDTTAPSDVNTEQTAPTEGNTEQTEPDDEVDTDLVKAQRITGIRSERSEGDSDPFPCDTEYEYDGSKLVRIKNYRDGVLEYEYTYDGSIDRPLTETVFFEDGTVEYCTEYMYDENGVLVSDVDGPNTTSYDYDEDNNLVKKTSYTDGVEIYRIEYVYSDGVLAEEIDYLDGEKYLHYLYEYDEDGNLVTIRDYDNEEWYVASYEYDSDGNLIHYGNEEDDYFYTYDEDGNLTGFEKNLSFGNEEAVIEFETVTVSESEARELEKIVEAILR